MKRITTLFVTALAALAMQAQTDMTARLTNPSFESNLDGWINDGMQAQSNNSFAIKAGNVYAEKWTGAGGKAGNASLKQTLLDMPNGNYTLTCVAQNIQQNADTDVQTGVYVQLNTDKTQVNLPGTYSVTADVTKGSIDIAFVISGATGNYVCVDNFRLTFNSCTQAQLGELTASAQTLTAQKMGDKAKTSLEAAIAAAQALTGETGITDAAAALSNAIATARESASQFAAFDAAIAEAATLATQKMSEDAKAELSDALSAAQALTTASDITQAAATLNTRIIAAKNSVAAYAAVQAALNAANEYHATQPANGADELKAVIDGQQQAYDAGTLNDVQCAAAVKALEAAVIACRVANATGAAPKVNSEHFMPMGCVAALGRMTATGSNIMEKGYVWATHPNPTVADNRSTTKYENNGDIYELSPLEPATCYYVRAYALTKTYAVAYGEEQRIYTLPKATCRWSYDEAGDDATNERIRNAVRDACDFYNTWTSIPGFHLNAHYVPGAGAGGGTADCSYGGYMRVSQSVSYQRTGTLLHESNHGVGVGTSARWKNWDGSNMRADGGERGQWMGWRATQMVRFFDHNETSILNGDGTHMWPYGINGAHEDDNRKISYIANTLITHAVHQDGLAAVDGIGASPAYTFEHEDEAKYYFTNTDPDHGAGTAFLYETSTGLLKWGEADNKTLKADDAYAWQLEYVPAKAHYRIKNAKSGRYFTYSGASIKTAKKTTPGTTENFQLMIAFNEVTVGEDLKVTKRPYYIEAGTGNFAPYTLNAGSKGATNGATLNLNRNEAATQRWLILNEEEAMTISSSHLEDHTNRLQELVDGSKTMLAVLHTEKTEGATGTFEKVVNETELKISAIATIADAKSEIAAFKKSICNFMEAAYPSELQTPYDLTFLIEDRNFTSDNSWDANSLAVPVAENGVASVEGAKFKYTQVLADMPAGIYVTKAQAYQTVEPTSYIYINSAAYKATVCPIGTDEETATLRFAQGGYDNEVVYKLLKRGNVTLGITNTKVVEGDKTVFGNFRLYFYGNDVTKDEVASATPVETVTATTGKPFIIHDLQGRRIQHPSRGLYIVGGKKVLIR